jgi:hypothetical protein
VHNAFAQWEEEEEEEEEEEKRERERERIFLADFHKSSQCKISQKSANLNLNISTKNCYTMVE